MAEENKEQQEKEATQKQIEEETAVALKAGTESVKIHDLSADNAKNFDWQKANKLSSSLNNVIDEKNFRLPEMGDFYLGAVDDVYLRMIDKAVNKRLGDAKAAAFYAENPPYKELGYDKDKDVYFLKANMQISDEALKLGLTDGGNINMDIEEITGDEEGVALKALKERLGDARYFQLHLAGLKAPRTAKWATEYSIAPKLIKVKNGIEQGWASQHSGYVYVPTNDDTTTFDFIYLNGTWRQMEVIDREESGALTFRWLMNPGEDGEVWDAKAKDGKGESVTYTHGQDAAKALQNIINKYGEIYFTVDGCGMDPYSENHPVSIPGIMEDISEKGQLEQLDLGEDLFENHKYHTGKFLTEQEARYRFDGECFVKVNDQFINVAKLMMTDTNLNLSPDENYEGPNRSVFKTNRYNAKARAYADAFFDTMAELDDRPDIVKECMGMEWDDLLDWDVTLGDVTFFVPPTSITSAAVTRSEREPLIRANGSMVKNGNHTVKTLQMEVYFNEERGINGYNYTCKNPKGEELHYSVNGLRALIAQFKFVPFVPITNDYINKTLGIGAVTVNSISINNVENYPKLIQATISMTEFDWQIYMPTLIQSCLPYDVSDKEILSALGAGTDVIQELNDDGTTTLAPAEEVVDKTLPARKNNYTNYFALSINWKTMRYYYQRAIRRGNYLKSLKLAADNDKYIHATMGQVTSLQPMDFVDPTITFYLANEEYMDKILKAKMEALHGKGDKTQIRFDSNQLEALKCFDQIYASLKNLPLNHKFTEGLSSPTLQGQKTTWCASRTGAYTPSFVSHSAKEIGDYNGLEVYAVDGSTQKLNGDVSAGNLTDISPLSGLNTAIEQIDTYLKAGAEEFQNGAIDWNSGRVRSTVESPDDNTRRYVFWIEYDLDPDLLTDSQMESFKVSTSNYDHAAPDQVLTNNTLSIPIYCDMQWDDDQGVWRAKDDMPFKLYSDHPDMLLLANAGMIYDEFKDNNQKVETIPDETKLDNLKFDKYDCGTVRIMNYNMLFSNRISEVHTQGVDGSAPQYLGGEDTTFTIYVKTTDRKTANRLLAIPKKISSMMRRYHAVVPCCPLRIDSEISRFAGIHEVSIEDVTLETSSNATGVYILRMDMISVNRTLRNQEVAEKNSIDNFQVRHDSSDVEQVGKTVNEEDTDRDVNKDKNKHFGSGVYDHVKFANYFKTKDILGQAELYPDLELPTIKEMEDEGWYFTRYKFQDSRVFVDPDFYFVYTTTLTSQYYREIAIKGMAAKMADTKLQDSTGASAVLKAAFGKGYVVEDKNPGLQEQERILKDVMDARNTVEQKEKEENLKDNNDNQALTLLNENGNREEWAVCKDINAQFLEKRYLREYRSYLSRQEAKTAGIIDKTNGASDISQDQKVAGEDTEEATKIDTKEFLMSDGSEITEERAKAILEDTAGKYSNEDLQVAKRYAEALESGQVGNDDAITEGAWVFANLENAASSAALIDEYLKAPISDNDAKAAIIKPKDPAMNGDVAAALTLVESANQKSAEESDTVSQEEISAIVTKFLQQSDLSAVWSGLNVQLSDKFMNLAGKIVYAAACAATGKKEYSGSDKATEWMPKRKYYGVRIGGFQDTNMATEIQDESEIGKKAIRFGTFNLRMYSAQDLQMLTGETVALRTEESDDPADVNNRMYVLDPYYRNASEEELEQYKVSCATNPQYCAWAFMRIMLYWLKKLIDMHAIPTMTSDVLRKASKVQLQIAEKQKEKDVEEAQNVEDEETGAVESLDSYRSFFEKRTYSIDAGKIWTAAVLAVSGGDKVLLDRIDSRDYDALNAYVESCASPVSRVEAGENGPMKIRKMTLALIPSGVISEISAVGITPTLPTQQFDIDKSEKKYLAAAEDPDTYIPHSWHDMIVHDARGRMLRAFPTFYMCLVDEGRDIGQWKLHDNFYSTAAISDMTIVKSRKLPADTATIRLSNFYNTYTTENSDFVTKGPNISFGETWDSLFSPSKTAMKEEMRRAMKPPEPKLRLRVGARIHIRLGYGSNADMLPIVFNGVIAEVSCEDSVEIIAQGDGVELTNPIMQDGIVDGEAKNLQTQDEFVSGTLGRIANHATPLQIATALFNSNGGPLRRNLRTYFKTSVFPRNPFGIVHFGDPDFTTICRSGECTQNIYEATYTAPIFGGNHNVFSQEYMDDKKKPWINFNLFKKSPWDCLNICKSINPDFRLAVLPFNFRSTVFMGLPRYYYAYDYYKSTTGAVLEKRKPFRQYHMYTSGEDIIGNGITASNRDMKTVAIGMYTDTSVAATTTQCTVGPLFADFDIYPEAQRTMVVDTSLLGRGSMLGDVTGGSYYLDRYYNENRSNKKIAWNSTASKLRESVQDMYTGDLVVLGDPTVKPEDFFWMNDAYTNMVGTAQVKEVVHHLSVEDGFTTTISPDVIASVNDPHEITAQLAMQHMGSVMSSIGNMATYLADAALGLIAASLALGLHHKYRISKGEIGALKRTGEQLKRGAKVIGGNAAKGAKEVAKKGFWKSLFNLKNIGKLFKTAKFLGGLAAGALASGGLELVIGAVSLISAPYLNSVFAEELKNLKVIKIFPLKRHGIPYTAGFEGSKGSVYGSPSWNERGVVGDLLAELTDNSIGQLVLNIFADDELEACVNKIKRNNEIVDSDGKPTDTNKSYATMVSILANKDVNLSNNALAQQQVQKTASYDNPRDVLDAYNEFKIMDTENYMNDPKLTNNSLISDDQRIRPYIEEEFFAILHETPALNEGSNVEEMTLKIGDEEKRVKVIHDTDIAGNPVVDLPMLHKNAVNVLYEILRRAKNKMPAANATDKLENYEATKTTYIVLKSALRVGDKKTQAAAGFTFILQPTDANAIKALSAAIQEITEDVDSDAKLFPGAGLNPVVFHFREDAATHEIAFVVPMPLQRTSEDEAQETQQPAAEPDTGSDEADGKQLEKEAQTPKTKSE